MLLYINYLEDRALLMGFLDQPQSSFYSTSASVGSFHSESNFLTFPCHFNVIFFNVSPSFFCTAAVSQHDLQTLQSFENSLKITRNVKHQFVAAKNVDNIPHHLKMDCFEF